MEARNHNIGEIQVALAGIASGTIPIFSTLLIARDTPVLMQVLFRLGCPVLVLAIPVCFFIGRKKWRFKGYFVPYIAVNGLLIFGAFFTYLSSIAIGTPVTKAVLLSYTYPIFAASFSLIILKEKLDRYITLSIILAMVGVSIVLEPWSTGGLTIGVGELLAIANGFLYAGIIVLGRYLQRSKEGPHPVSFTFFSFVFALPWFGVAAGLLHFYPLKTLSLGGLSDLHFIALLYLMCLGLISTLLPYSLLFIGLQKIEATAASIFLLFEPISVFVLGRTILGQPIGLWQIVGGICILGAAVVSSRKAHPAAGRQYAP